ncbi:MAG: lysozyme [Candidatus Andeanibacterium colombiense]|uniref:Lysozyme n=1 Tax=Candidatus Andeanibacterium colombiense TaxID=3121345 RepID=A0AAJ5X9I0_9SPHN|nr:MAG: lysozyme [Sphingomonadaceae bacterium]
MNRRPIFDAVRALRGQGFTQAEVDALDEAIDLAEGSLPARKTASPIPAPAPAGGRTIGAPGLALIKLFEGCEKRTPGGKFEAYPDPGTGDKPWTIGWGATGPGIAPGTVWTQAQCDTRLTEDMRSYAAAVERALGGAPCTANQFDALVSFHYNTGAIASATLTKKHIARDYDGAKAEFAKWNRAGGRVMPGLVRRRAAEAKLYATVL